MKFKEGDELKTTFEDEGKGVMNIFVVLSRGGEEILYGSFKGSKEDEEGVPLAYSRLLHRMEDQLECYEKTGRYTPK